MSAEILAAAKAVFRPDLYDAALPGEAGNVAGAPSEGIGAFAGPVFDGDDVAAYLAASTIRRG
jgi:two-component system, oxyanion-binding sensor